MCTVIYLPGDTPLFLSNRDESPQRPRALVPAIYEKNGIHYLCPIDPSGGGTWVGVNERKEVVILMNGAFVKHLSQPPYAKSRGLIVTELLSAEMPVITWNLLDMTYIEPYTLVVFTDAMLFELVWDGKQKHRKSYPTNEAHIWSSSTLYSAEVKAKRKVLFQEWLAVNPEHSKAAVQAFIHSWNDQENGFIMNRREQVKTLSTSIIELSSHEAVFYFETIDGREKNSVKLPLPLPDELQPVND
jgi:uncharacterized protein with NRDE domain